MFCNNSAAILVAKNNKSDSRSKHIDIKYLVIKKRIKEKKVVRKYVSIELILVDPLIKGLPPLRFKDHIGKIGSGSIM